MRNARLAVEKSGQHWKAILWGDSRWGERTGAVVLPGQGRRQSRAEALSIARAVPAADLLALAERKCGTYVSLARAKAFEVLGEVLGPPGRPVPTPLPPNVVRETPPGYREAPPDGVRAERVGEAILQRRALLRAELARIEALLADLVGPTFEHPNHGGAESSETRH